MAFDRPMTGMMTMLSERLALWQNRVIGGVLGASLTDEEDISVHRCYWGDLTTHFRFENNCSSSYVLNCCVIRPKQSYTATDGEAGLKRPMQLFMNGLDAYFKPSITPEDDEDLQLNSHDFYTFMTQSPLFSRLWKVTKRVSRVLNAGENFSIDIKTKLNRMFDINELLMFEYNKDYSHELVYWLTPLSRSKYQSETEPWAAPRTISVDGWYTGSIKCPPAPFGVHSTVNVLQRNPRTAPTTVPTEQPWVFRPQTGAWNDWFTMMGHIIDSEDEGDAMDTDIGPALPAPPEPET